MYLTFQDILERFAISRSTFYRWQKNENFPQAKKFGTVARWKLSDVQEWEDNH